MMVAESLRSRLLKPHNSRQQVGGLDTGSIGDKATVVTAFISPAAEHLAEKLEPSGRSGGRSPYSESYYAGSSGWLEFFSKMLSSWRDKSCNNSSLVADAAKLEPPTCWRELWGFRSRERKCFSGTKL